jgi:hypothetical protein
MPTIRGVTNLAAGASNNNVLAGSAYEFLPINARVDIGITADAAGTARATVQSGSDVLLEESPVSRAARVPVWPDDYDLSDIAVAGDRLKIAARNTGGVAIDVFWSVRVTPLQ